MLLNGYARLIFFLDTCVRACTALITKDRAESRAGLGNNIPASGLLVHKEVPFATQHGTDSEGFLDEVNVSGKGISCATIPWKALPCPLRADIARLCHFCAVYGFGCRGASRTCLLQIYSI